MPTEKPGGGPVGNALSSVISIALAMLACFAALAIGRGTLRIAGEAYLQMIWGGLADFPSLLRGGGWEAVSRPWGEAASKGSLLILTGLSVSVALRVGFFNIGAQGQMILGAIAAAFLGSAVTLPAFWHSTLCIASAAACGGMYAWLPAVLKVRRGVHEVISTIMLNWIAVYLVENWLVAGPLRASSGSGTSRSGTDLVHATAELPRLLGEASRLNAGFPLALLLAIGVWCWMTRTHHGFETRVVGLGPEVARISGIPAERRVYQALICAGALAGIAGAVWVLGTEHRYPVTLSSPYGFDGIAIALVGQNHPAGIVAVAAFFGILRAGGTRMQLLGIHKSFPEIIEGFSLLFIAAQLIWTKLARRAPGSPGEEVPRA